MTSPSDAAQVPYREGLSAVLGPYRARLDRVAARAGKLDAEARDELPVEVRERLAAAAAAVITEPGGAGEVARAEEALDAYEQQLEEALWLVGELRDLRAAARRRRELAVRVMLGGIVALALGMVALYGASVWREAEAARACRASSECANEGRCGPWWVGDLEPRQCVAVSSVDCARSEGCAYAGACSLVGRMCAVGGEHDCRASSRCRNLGFCAFAPAEYGDRHVDARCVPSEEGCRASADCGLEGRCALREERCVARSDADCARSQVCAGGDACVSNGERCVVCEESEACRKEGRCSLREGQCVAASAADCAKSAACQERCACDAVDGKCEPGPTPPGYCGGRKRCSRCRRTRPDADSSAPTDP